MAAGQGDFRSGDTTYLTSALLALQLFEYSDFNPLAKFQTGSRFCAAPYFVKPWADGFGLYLQGLRGLQNDQPLCARHSFLSARYQNIFAATIASLVSENLDRDARPTLRGL